MTVGPKSRCLLKTKNVQFQPQDHSLSLKEKVIVSNDLEIDWSYLELHM